MNDYTYQKLTLEKIESVMKDIFSPNRVDPRRRFTTEQYWRSLNLSYPSTPDESFKNKSTEIMKGNELDITITDRNRSYGDSRIYRYKINGESVLRFEQIPYPECCGITIIKNFSANGDMSKADFLDAMDQFLADIKKNDRYSKILFYTASGNVGERLFSMINGITILDPFKNKRSGNTLVGFEIDLLDKSTSNGFYDADFEEALVNGQDDDEDEEEEDDTFGLATEADAQIVMSRSVPLNLNRTIQPVEYIDSDGRTRAEYTISYNSDNPTGINRSSNNS